ncbi:hypothetical protein FIBSPDRAFT_889257 [Athelia psychrophila]|uniref:Uncharacterized protein n=1 Tax=Athelia psychrophila TaxID=1759441 RepID=A0A166MIX9_9AGAM|nr:hypothetical protein FIBSPDRAFT_889257 [Fibularhizoctonia sp. CBS 109695]
MVWTEQSRKCPLCAQPIREHLIHHLRARYDYQKHYLALPQPAAPPCRDRAWGRHARMTAEERQVADALEREIAKPKWVYEHRLFAKHVASNPYTRYRPAPVPAAFTTNPVLVAGATALLRRELLTKAVDVRSKAAVRLLAEFLDVDGREVAEHFAQEVYAYLRSPCRDLSVYDSIVQYDTLKNIPPPAVLYQSRRWRPAPSPSRFRSLSLSRSRSRERGLDARPKELRGRDLDSLLSK